MTTPKGEHAALVETSFRVVSSRLVAITRVRAEAPPSLPTPLSHFMPLQSTQQHPYQQHLLPMSTPQHQHQHRQVIYE